MTANPSLAESPRVEDWITVRPDGFVEVRTGKVEIGQRITTAVALVAARELGVPFDRVVMEPARTGRSPDEGYTSGSNSMEQSGHAVRLAAATARRELVARAARRLGVDAATLETGEGLVRSRETNRTLRFGELVEGAPLSLPVDPKAVPRAGAEEVSRSPRIEPLHLRGLVTGTLRFVHDLQPEGALHARVIRPPHYHASLVSLPDDIETRLEGARLVRDGSFLAVAAEDEHQAIRAAARVAAAARGPRRGGLDERPIPDQLLHNRRESFPVRDCRPREEPVPEPPPDTPRTVRAVYERPYQMHGSLGPSAALARFDADRLTVWTHSQGVYPLRASIAETLGLAPESVDVEHAPGAGCYGHNGSDDAALEAALVARAIPGRSVLLKWTREDEHAWEPYGPAMRMELSAHLDDAGDVRWWSPRDAERHPRRARPAGRRPLPGGPVPRPPLPRKPGARARADAKPHRERRHPPQRHPALRVPRDPHRQAPRARPPPPGLRPSHPRRLRQRLRRRVLHGRARPRGGSGPPRLPPPAPRGRAHPRGARRGGRALRLDGAAGGRASPWPPGTGRGIAVARYKNAKGYCAVAVEARVGDDAVVRLLRAVIAADAGEIVDPDGLAAQLEGGFVQAASWTLLEAVAWDRDGITSRDWESYPILRFDAIPEVETVLVDRPGEPFLGAGEASCGPAGAAIANAVFDATGVRARRLPLTPEHLRAAAADS